MKALSFFANPLNLFISRMAEISAKATADSLTDQAINSEKTLSQTNWTGTRDRNWLHAENWSNGLPTSQNHAYIPLSPTGGQFPMITEDCLIDFTIKNDGVITNKGNISITAKGLLQNYGIFENVTRGHILNCGNMVNCGTMVNTGNIENKHVMANGNVIENSGTITNEQQIVDLKKLYQSGFKDMPTLS